MAFDSTLRISQLRVTDGRGRVLLDIPELHCAQGQLIGIAGPSGSGKSTLLLALAGLLQPASGNIQWGQTVFNSLVERKRTAFRNEHMGVVFQDSLLFDEMTALANASVGALWRNKRSGIRDKASRWLEQEGIDVSDRAAGSYSGGEQQRIAIARALAHEPDIVLADEPTASLDRVTSGRIVAELKAWASRGNSVFVISHDPEVLSDAHQVIELRDGKLALSSTADNPSGDASAVTHRAG